MAGLRSKGSFRGNLAGSVGSASGTEFCFDVQRAPVESRGRALQVVGENPAVDFGCPGAQFIEGRPTPLRVVNVRPKTSDCGIDILQFLDPGRRKTVYAEQVVRHPHARIRVDIQLDWLALVREVIELAGFDGLPDLALRDGFPLIQISVLHKEWAGDLAAALGVGYLGA